MGKGIGILELDSMEFYSFHGVLEREKTTGNHFTVDFRGELDMTTAIESDNLKDALDYSKIYEAVAAEMAIHSDLLENLAGRIVKRIAEEFPQLRSFSIRVSKKRPPVNGIIQWSRITLFYNYSGSEKEYEQ